MQFVVLCLCLFGQETTQQQDARADNQKSARPADPQLRRELLRRSETDEKVRKKWIRLLRQEQPDPDKLKAAHEQVRSTDKANREWLRAVVRKQGWPGRTLVGKDGAHAAWLLVQHADEDRRFQSDCLAAMTRMPKGEVDGTDIAYLTDRVHLATGRKQVYGTQVESRDGKWQPRPVEDPEKLDARRRTVGLPPMAEYLRTIERVYGSAERMAAKQKQSSGSPGSGSKKQDKNREARR